MRKRLQKLMLMQPVLCMVMSIFFFSAKGQNYGSVPNIMPPEVASLGKFGAYPISYYTGSPNISVPLYNLKESDIAIDLSLQYDASGFIPNKESGIAGLNWSLMAGGVITRVVNWAPDDRNDNSTGEALKTYKGYIQGMLNLNYEKYDSAYIRKLSFLGINDQGMPFTSLQYEYSPDVFSFNFNGHTGKFFLGNDGKVKVVGEQNYKVDLAGLTGQSNLCDGANSSISITSEDGYTYTFGGDINTLEITYPYAGETENISCAGVINAWHLRTIKTNTGKLVTFNYEPQNKTDIASAANKLLNPGIDYAYEKIYFNEKIGTQFKQGGQLGINTINKKIRSLIKTTYLSSITTPASTITFEYTKKIKSIYPGSENILNPNLTKQLENILVKNSAGKIIKQIDLSYTDYGSDMTGYRQFLSEINDVNLSDPSKTSQYQFEYYKTDNLPKALTKGIDLWGYYNGKDGNSSLVLDISSGFPDYEMDITHRKADPNYCDIGLLKTITFPTSGSTEFKYENHDYSKVLRKKVLSGMVPQWFNETGYVGGARIKEINESSGVKRSFKYVKNYSTNIANPVSSGISTDHDVFYLDYERPFNNIPNAKDILVQDNNIAASASYGESPIGYSEVTEISNEGYTKYFYSTQETNPDKYNLGGDSYKLTPLVDNSSTNFQQQLKRLAKYSTCDIERGKMLTTEVYNKNEQLLKKVVNKYNEDPFRYKEATIGFNFPYWVDGYALYHSYALYNFQNNIKQQQVFDYGNNNTPTLTQTINYVYKSNSNPILIQKDEINSKIETFTNKYKYPNDFAANIPYNTMVEQNFIAPVIEQTSYKNGVLLNTVTNTYKKLGNNIIVPDLIKTKKNGFTENTEITYNTYDNAGNLLQHTVKNNNPASLIWDYKSVYPIAECTNAVATDIAATSFEADGKGNFTFAGALVSDITALAGKKVYSLSSGSITKTSLNAAKTYMVSYWSKNGQQAVSASSVTAGLTKNGWTLYKHKVVNPANGTITISGNGTIDELKLYPEEGKMTAYTYDPLIGISSKDDMNEEISYYKYDGLHRLICIYDMDKKVIKKFCYNYAGQPENCSSDIVYYNQQMSQAFVRNNCQPGYTGTEVIYTIPAETYSSLISQADADSKAQNDINTTGQFYANTNGNCLIMYYNQPLSKFFFKNDCQAGYSGTKVLYEVPASKYNSVISQADANAKAQADMDANGQAYANTNGNCVLGCLKCIGEANKCINAICETGAKVVTDTYGSGKDWWCVYHYEWSDGTYSQDYIEKGFLPCPITQ